MPHFILPKTVPADRGIYEFSKTVTATQETTVTVSIYAATRYIFTHNGHYVCEGPCRGIIGEGLFDRVPLTLSAGENTFTFKIMHLNPVAYGSFPQFSTVARTVEPYLLVEADGDEFHLESDESWACRFFPGHALVHNYPEIGFPAPFEEIDTTIKPIALETVIEPVEADFVTGQNGKYGYARMTPLSLRPIPMIYPQATENFAVVKRGENFLELDAGRYVTAKITAKLYGKGRVKFIYSECYRFPDGKHRRDDSNGFLDGPYDRVTVDGEYTFESFWFRAFRYIRVETEGKEKKNDLDALLSTINFSPVHYPLKRIGHFACSDAGYNAMVDIGIRTLLCCMHEIFVDCPYYEQQQYCMDSAVEAAAWLTLSDDTRPVRKCLNELAASQIPTGLLCANYPATYTQIIPGFSFFWLFLLKDYYDFSGDIDFVRRHLATADKILTYFDEEVRKQGLIGHSTYWDYADWVPTWNNGVPPTAEDDCITLYNLYYACGLKTASALCRASGRVGMADEYDVRYEELKKTVFENCFDTERGLFFDGKDAHTYSAHTVVWGILSGFLTDEAAKKAVDNLFCDDVAQCSFSMNYYLLRALRASGRYDLAFSKVLPMWQPMIDNGCTTWCESPEENTRSECHAWSCAPLYEFSHEVLGVRVCDGIVTVEPHIGSLTWARGDVPTRFGTVSVDWKIDENDAFILSVKTDFDGEKKILLPDGRETAFEGRKITITIDD